ncbi:MAG: hypothetical protein ACOX5G_07000 [Kiritimatiellia bacterium]|jgi:hypothetical protein
MKRTTRPLLAALAAACIAANATAGPVGVSVNGDMLDSAGSSGNGWVYASPVLTLSGEGPFTIAGTNTSWKVVIAVPAGTTNTVTLADLVLWEVYASQGAFVLETNACVTLFLSGTSKLDSRNAGIEVPPGASLSITNAPGDEAGALVVTARSGGAGIGGRANSACGTVTISGGTITATGASSAAGIGGGNGGAGGTITISGGTVTATTGTYGAGIGGGSNGDAGTITISGGTVTATGGAYGAGIGGGENGSGGVVKISGGCVAATGGSSSAGIGGGQYADGGTVEISGGDVHATASYGAGIGGGYKGDGGDVILSGGTVTATGGGSSAGIGGGGNGNGANVTIFNGTVTATGGESGAGIGSGSVASGGGGEVEIRGGTVTATGGKNGAGIGGGYRTDGGTVTISGGSVTATGGQDAAGIGGGSGSTYNPGGAGGTVTISGGTVTTTGGCHYNNTFSGGAGIGGGYKGGGALLTVSGGTVFATGAGGSADAGPGLNSAIRGLNRFTGGSIRLANTFPSPAPSNDTERVGCAMTSGFAPGEAVEITPFLSGTMPYGVNGIVADEDGCIYLWLPEGVHAFTANGRNCTAKVENGTGVVGVTINGEDVAFGSTNSAAGWIYDPPSRVLTLSGAGPFTLAGTNKVGAVSVVVPDRTTNTVTLANLTLWVTGADRCAFALGQYARMSLRLAGANALVSGDNRAGLEVAANRTLLISNAPGDDTATLTATSGDYAAGIGGGRSKAGGTIEIAGGNVTATGGKYGAGIGGGYYGAGGTLTLSGGSVVAMGGYRGGGIGGGLQYAGGSVTISGGTATAVGGDGAAGIGGGYAAAGGTVDISGGRVTATGGDGAAGIGGGSYNSAGKGGTVTISGGTVVATGTGGATDIGPGAKATLSGANTFTGGSIRLANGAISLVPSNGTVRVWCVTVPGLTPGATPELEVLPQGYGTNDLFADENGTLYLWLPNGEYVFVVNGVPYVATVADADAAVTTHYFTIAAFELADDTATFTLAERLPPDLFDEWINTVTAFEVQYCTNLTEAVWTTLPGTARDGMTLTVPFTPPDSPRLFLRVLAE